MSPLTLQIGQKIEQFLPNLVQALPKFDGTWRPRDYQVL